MRFNSDDARMRFDLAQALRTMGTFARRRDEISKARRVGREERQRCGARQELCVLVGETGKSEGTVQQPAVDYGFAGWQVPALQSSPAGSLNAFLASMPLALAAAGLVWSCQDSEPAGSEQLVSLDVLSDRDAYARLDRKEVRALAVAAAKRWVPQFAGLDFLRVEEIAAGSQHHCVAQWRHRASGVLLALIPGGRFQMGSANFVPTLERYRDADRDEGRHWVPVAPFLIAVTECTQEQWAMLAEQAGVDRAPSSFPGADLPVESVTATQVDTWCRAAGLMLPTEAQWEFAARAGTTTSYSCGDDASTLRPFANIADASTDFEWRRSWNDGFPYTAPVGSFQPNAFGLHDVHGNVWEWTRDDYLGYDTPIEAGTSARLGSSGQRAARGGSYRGSARDVRSAFRFAVGPDYSFPYLGFRPSLDLPVDTGGQ